MEILRKIIWKVKKSKSKTWNAQNNNFLNFFFYRAENLIEGHDYNFRVKAVNKIGESLPLVCQSPITAKDPFGRPDRPGQPTVTDWGKDHVDLEWTPPKKDGGSPISQYIIEKKPKYG